MIIIECLFYQFLIKGCTRKALKHSNLKKRLVGLIDPPLSGLRYINTLSVLRVKA